MIIGVDFDNTIVCYDKVFHEIAVKKGLMPKNAPATKDDVRNYLRRHGKEDKWIELQGIGYGPEILNAEPFPGVMDFFMLCKKNKINVYIISHKTLHPFRGSKYNLHNYAQKWLQRHGFYNPKIGLSKKHVFFELTKEEKLKKIANLKCTHFIEDLPEFFAEKNFPKGVVKILFDPNSRCKSKGFECAASWKEITEIIK